ncbi:glutamic acid-rich protein-like [Helianthus annuus]|uniref:glutamic acid-rich protein-like n=1 Tax=Helianthus annuus TaxID=4232 RepID=UPI000B8F6712|nr:glutamic acid-rich protein-like [Helianthus annuus]
MKKFKYSKSKRIKKEDVGEEEKDIDEKKTDDEVTESEPGFLHEIEASKKRKAEIEKIEADEIVKEKPTENVPVSVKSGTPVVEEVVDIRTTESVHIKMPISKPSQQTPKKAQTPKKQQTPRLDDLDLDYDFLKELNNEKIVELEKQVEVMNVKVESLVEENERLRVPENKLQINFDDEVESMKNLEKETILEAEVTESVKMKADGKSLLMAFLKLLLNLQKIQYLKQKLMKPVESEVVFGPENKVQEEVDDELENEDDEEKEDFEDSDDNNDDDDDAGDDIDQGGIDDIVRRKMKERTKKGKSPRIDKRETVSERQKWFRNVTLEKKFRRPLSFFTRNKYISLGDIISWCWIPDLKVVRDQALQYQRVMKFCYAYDIHSGRMWDKKWRTIEKKGRYEREEMRTKD